MKKVMTYLLTVLCVCLCFTGLAWADAAGDWYQASSASYDVTVAAPDGYVNVRSGPGTEYDVISSAGNGTVIHIDKEATASNGKRWGQGSAGGAYGWIALSQVKKGSSAPKTETQTETKPEPLITTLYEGGTATNYSVKVSAPDGGLNLRYGPGSKYEIRVSMMPNGTILNVKKTAKADNGKMWGYTNYNGTYGWIFLNETTKIESAKPEAKVVVTEEEPELSTSEDTELSTDKPKPPQPADASNSNSRTGESSGLLSNPMMLFIPLVIIAILLAGILAALLIRRK